MTSIALNNQMGVATWQNAFGLSAHENDSLNREAPGVMAMGAARSGKTPMEEAIIRGRARIERECRPAYEENMNRIKAEHNRRMEELVVADLPNIGMSSLGGIIGITVGILGLVNEDDTEFDRHIEHGWNAFVPSLDINGYRALMALTITGSIGIFLWGFGSIIAKTKPLAELSLHADNELKKCASRIFAEERKAVLAETFRRDSLIDPELPLLGSPNFDDDVRDFLDGVTVYSDPDAKTDWLLVGKVAGQATVAAAIAGAIVVGGSSIIAGGVGRWSIARLGSLLAS